MGHGVTMGWFSFYEGIRPTTINEVTSMAMPVTGPWRGITLFRSSPADIPARSNPVANGTYYVLYKDHTSGTTPLGFLRIERPSANWSGPETYLHAVYEKNATVFYSTR